MEKNLKKNIYIHTHTYVCVYNRITLLYTWNIANKPDFNFKKFFKIQKQQQQQKQTNTPKKSKNKKKKTKTILEGSNLRDNSRMWQWVSQSIYYWKVCI